MTIKTQLNNKRDEKTFKEFVENIVLNKNDLQRLKQFLHSTCGGKIDDRPIREFIFQERLKMVESIAEIFPYYVQLKKNRITRPVARKERKEQERLLEQVSQKIHSLCAKLKEKVELK